MIKKQSTSLMVIDEAIIPAHLVLATKTLIPQQSLSDENEVRDQLPQVIGKLLALCWINKELAQFFLSDPKTFLEKIDIALPDNISIDVNKEFKGKPSITVFQTLKSAGFKQRLFKLSLKLIANR